MSDKKTIENSIKYQWKLLQVVSDGSVNEIGPDNFLLIEEDVLFEIVSQGGKRRYPYTRDKSTLYVTQGEKVNEW